MAQSTISNSRPPPLSVIEAGGRGGGAPLPPFLPEKQKASPEATRGLHLFPSASPPPGGTPDPPGPLPSLEAQGRGAGRKKPLRKGEWAPTALGEPPLVLRPRLSP